MDSRQWLAPVEHGDTAAAIRSNAQCSGTTRGPLHHQPKKPVKTSKPLTSRVIKLDAGAYSFFGALLVEPHGPLVVAPSATSEEPKLLKGQQT